MMNATGRTWQAALVAAMMLTAGCEKPQSQPQPSAKVTIRGQSWQVELATTADQRYQGFSDRKDLPAGRGMLFIFPQPQVLDFCMRFCLIPLDIAFIGPDMRVVKIYTMEVEPYGFDTKHYDSEVPAQYALEVPKGALATAGVQVGDKVEFSSDMPSAAKAEPSP
jgi:uncharacterized membrane protein (UPF0127 family)